MTKQEMMNEMAKSFGLENEYVISFFHWCENNPNASYTDLMETYNTHVSNAVREITDNSEQIW